MQNTKISKWIIFALLAFIVLLSTCNLSNKTQSPSDQLQDTIFLSQWRREKQEKIAAIISYEKHIYELEKLNDSLQSQFIKYKKSMLASRTKATSFDRKLKDALVAISKTDSTTTDSLTPLLDSLSLYKNQADYQCDSTIAELEHIVLNQDSCITDHLSIEEDLRHLNTMQELEILKINSQLTTSLKSNHKILRQNKLLKAGALILTGITTSFLINRLAR